MRTRSSKIAVGIVLAWAVLPAGAAEGLEWLVGEWERASRNGTTIERWKQIEGGGLVGEAVVLRPGSDAETQTEALLLVEMGGETFYVAKPRENPYPVGFRLVKAADGIWEFENPTHDFPQRIVYRRESADALHVSIEGPAEGGERQTIDYRFVRRKSAAR